MKKYLFIIFVVLLLLSCNINANIPAAPANDVTLPEQDISPVEPDVAAPANTDNNNTGSEAPQEIPPTVAPTCYEGEHPIAISIVEQYATMTTYDEVMLWFCNGAQFEDILNALVTEEMTDTDTEDLLLQIAEGKTWNDIWLELGITE